MQGPLTATLNIAWISGPVPGGGGGRRGGGGGGAGGGGGGEADQEAKGQSKTLKDQAKFAKDRLTQGSKNLKQTLGINFGIASILKQSQIYTGLMGTIFQLMGALVDVMLAPFLPILIPAIRLMADMIPIVADYSRRLFEFLDKTLFSWFRAIWGKFPSGVQSWIKNALAMVIIGMFWLKILGLLNPAIIFLKFLFNIFVKAVPKLLGFLIRFSARFSLFSGFWSRVGTKLSGLFPMIKNFIATLGTRIGLLRIALVDTVKGLPAKIGGWLHRNIWTKFTGMLKGAMTALSKFSIMGKKPFAALARVAGRVGVGSLIKGAKMVPILGAAATLGFGAYETVQAVRQHGWKRGAVVAGRTALSTAAQVALGPVGGIATEMALRYATRNMYTNGGGTASSGAPVVNVYNQVEGQETIKKESRTIDKQREQEGIVNELEGYVTNV